MKIVGIGTPCMDYISVVEKLPKPNMGTGVLECSRQGGGIVPTAVIAAARLGADCGFIGVTGSCVNSMAVREDFTRHGIDLSRSIIHENAYLDFAVILCDQETNGRSIIYKRGDTRTITVKDLDKEYIQSADYLHLAAMNEPCAAAAKWMREAGKTVVFDATNYTKDVIDHLGLIDVFIGSEFCYRDAFGDTSWDSASIKQNCVKLMEKGPGSVIFTLGEKGSAGMSNEGYFEAKAYTVEIADTLGAGDVYHGAFLFGLTKGWSIEKTAVFSNAVAALQIGAIGGRAGIPSYEAVERFLETGIVDEGIENERKERVEYYRNKWMFG